MKTPNRFVFGLFFVVSQTSNAFDAWTEVHRTMIKCGRAPLFSTEDVGQVYQDEVTGGYEGSGCTTTIFSLETKPVENIKIYACGDFDSANVQELRVWKNTGHTPWDQAEKLFDFYEDKNSIFCR